MVGLTPTQHLCLARLGEPFLKRARSRLGTRGIHAGARQRSRLEGMEYWNKRAWVLSGTIWSLSVVVSPTEGKDEHLNERRSRAVEHDRRLLGVRAAERRAPFAWAREAFALVLRPNRSKACLYEAVVLLLRLDLLHLISGLPWVYMAKLIVQAHILPFPISRSFGCGSLVELHGI